MFCRLERHADFNEGCLTTHIAGKAKQAPARINACAGDFSRQRAMEVSATMSNDNPDTNANEVLENARVEYAATNDAYMHYDNFSWQVGSVLLVGVFAYWGFIVSAGDLPARNLLLGNLLVCLLMSVWLLYAAHNRQIYLFKLHRIRELETLMGMLQHRRFVKYNGRKAVYSISGPHGHFLDVAVYLIVSSGGVLPEFSKTHRAAWNCFEKGVFAVNVILVVVVFSLTLFFYWQLGRKIKLIEKRVDRE